MGYVDILKLIKSDDLSDEQKSSLKRRVEERKRERQADMGAVDQDLEALRRAQA